jgi:hypothetical protein
MTLFSPNWLFLYPGLALVILGMCAGAVLLKQPIYVGGVRFSVDSLIYCAMVIEIGFQAILFALLSRTYAIQEGLFPKPARPSLFDRVFTLEKGIILGTAMIILGMLLFFNAIGLWAGADFGLLEFEHVTRIVISSSLLMSLGFEIVLTSFLLSILKLNVRVG